MDVQEIGKLLKIRIGKGIYGYFIPGSEKGNEYDGQGILCPGGEQDVCLPGVYPNPVQPFPGGAYLPLRPQGTAVFKKPYGFFPLQNKPRCTLDGMVAFIERLDHAHFDGAALFFHKSIFGGCTGGNKSPTARNSIQEAFQLTQLVCPCDGA